MRNKNNRLALVRQRFHDAEEVVGLLRREDRGRLVENQDIRVAVKQLNNFDTLLD